MLPHLTYQAFSKAFIPRETIFPSLINMPLKKTPKQKAKNKPTPLFLFFLFPSPHQPGVLEDISTRGDTESRSGLAEVVSEMSLALARRSTDWVASASELEHFSNRNAERAEATFSKYTVQLRSKVRKERGRAGGGDVKNGTGN